MTGRHGAGKDQLYGGSLLLSPISFEDRAAAVASIIGKPCKALLYVKIKDVKSRNNLVHISLWEQSLLAMASGQSAFMLNVPTSSRASLAPTNFVPTANFVYDTHLWEPPPQLISVCLESSSQQVLQDLQRPLHLRVNGRCQFTNR
ncbi:hypothetical protein DKY63_02635 [Pseudomonas putida]|uniref:Uncharacterized protein n=1 Tax=Pseudomonas putida TaxID=303 RepID=A0A2Z4RCZ5_PSEPU|nr:hypothetical protein DKY63_02635 [Pseudomonas putida]